MSEPAAKIRGKKPASAVQRTSGPAPAPTASTTRGASPGLLHAAGPVFNLGGTIQRQSDVNKIEPKRPTTPLVSSSGVALATGNMGIQRRATGRSDGTLPEPGPWTRAALRSGGGDPLSGAARARMESALGADLGRVRIHTDTLAARAAQELEASAFTVGQDVYFGAGNFRPGTAQGEQLLAHELTHTLQNLPGDSNAYPNHVLPPNSSAEKEAQAGVHMVGRGQPTRLRAAAIARQPLAPPPESTVQLGADLESDNPFARGAAMQQLRDRDDEAAWRALLLAQRSRNADVRAEAQALIAWKIGQQPSFETFIRELANSPRGVLSDLAILALTAVQGGMLVDVANYRMVIHQRLTLARDFLSQMELQLSNICVTAGIPELTDIPPAAYAINTLELHVDITPIGDLWELGLQASNLLDQLGQIRAAVQEVQALSGQFEEEGAVKILAQNQLIRLLTQARMVSGMEDDPAFGPVLDALSSWPGRFAAAIVDDLHKKFTEVRDELNDQMGDVKFHAIRKAWAKFRELVIIPLRDDLNVLIAEFDALRPEAASNPDAVFGQLQGLQAPMKALSERLLYTLQTANIKDQYIELVITDDQAKDLFQQTEQDLSDAFMFMAQIAYDRDKDPEAARIKYEHLINSSFFKATQKSVQFWEEVLAREEAFGRFLLDVAIVIASIYTGGLAGGIVRGVFGTAASLGGRVAVGALAFGADVTAFTLTSRGLRWAVYGESFTEGLGSDLVKNALMFGFLKGTASVYERFGAPLLPKALRPLGATTSTFVAFQTWSVGFTLYDTGEWIGMADPRFWQMAAHNALFLGVIHLGMKITKPLVAPVQEGVLQFQIASHNRRCAALETMIRTWTGTERPAQREGAELLRRARALYRERLDVLREINRVNPEELTAEELQQAEAVMVAQIQGVENTLLQSRFNITAHETAPNTFYYEGTSKEFRELYERQGYEVIEEDVQTGRIRLRSPNGDVIDMIRTSETPTEMRGRTQAEIEAEQRIAAATTVDAYLAALRQQSHPAGSVGASWDYSRFPEAPRGRAGQWQVGDPIDMPSTREGYPSYKSTGRKRYWMNRAHFEIQARARGEVSQDPASLDPMRCLSNPDLQSIRQSGRAPPAPGFPGRTMELEHSGVPQRVEAWLRELGFTAEEARRLAEVSSPKALLEVRPFEHAFFDFFAKRADIAGDTWSGTRDADIRRTRPMEPMREATIRWIVQESARRGYNFNRNAETRSLRAAIDAEIDARNITIYLP